MSTKIAIIGSTGLIGNHFLKSIGKGDYQSVQAITRRPIPNLEGRPYIKQVIVDFSDLNQLRPALQADVLVCALGTTIKTAGSKEAFMRVDHDLPLEIAKIAREEGCKTMVLISSVGANADSSVFYSRVKGRLENDLDALGFENLHILRPSMLLGHRDEQRPGEVIGKLVMRPLSILIPWKYKPIHASQLVAAIQRAISSNQKGTHIWEGKRLFELN
ncbi:MAG: NAD-dependent epimerase/dehydratase family protein [Candidatus Marinimicrobia bacterium]|nr:NAD-dependent epimerase/dehydratase family protein [Candidatus Neomarinimicrobiota bacterium]MCF7904411.1 NAD-dependent epimerase/dehydratase family protein [Candidatus Neomarinimicrobiota bacterium]